MHVAQLIRCHSRVALAFIRMRGQRYPHSKCKNCKNPLHSDSFLSSKTTGSVLRLELLETNHVRLGFG